MKPKIFRKKSSQNSRRLPLSRAYAEALKRESLQRQLKHIEPSTMQDMLEEALEPWLRKHGLLP